MHRTELFILLSHYLTEREVLMELLGFPLERQEGVGNGAVGGVT